MASQADDSSLEDNASSVGDGAWDIIDDTSIATSDDEDHGLSRQQTPSTDDIEHDHDIVESVDGNNTSDESQGLASTHEKVDFGKVQHDDNSESRESRDAPSVDHMAQFEEEMEDTNKCLRPLPALPFRSQPFKFLESTTTGTYTTGFLEVSHYLKRFDHDDCYNVCQNFELQKPPTSLVATVRQKMSDSGIHVTEPYKVIFVGPTSVKQPIIQKIGSALASSFDLTLTRSEEGLSKFTVVPISFGDGESPEVILLDSMGLDMTVEECTSALLFSDHTLKDEIHLKLKDHKLVKSSWDRVSNKFNVSADYRLPDLAVLYLPNSETIEAKQTRIMVRSFMIRHHVPVIMIASETDWTNFARPMTLDPRTPHICLEARDDQDQVQQVLRRFPVDLQTFLDIDSSQMGRNLACIVSETTKVTTVPHPTQHHSVINAALGSWPKRIRTLVRQETRYTSFYGTCLLAALFLYGAAMASIRTFDTTPMPQLANVELKTSQHTPISNSHLKPTPIAFSSTSPQTLTAQSSISLTTSDRSVPKSISPVLRNTDLASMLMEPSLASHKPTPNTSDKFRLQVLGDCHVILTPPKWFTRFKKAPALLFNVTRGKEALDYEFSTLFDGVYALKLAREDAYGALNISVWTVKRPKINETFQVDFGTPWLKIAGWKKAAQAITEQVRGELQSAQSGLNLAYGQTSIGVQVLVRDAVRKADAALREVEKIGLASLNQTSRTTEIMIAQSKELSQSITQHLQQHGTKVSTRLIKQRKNLRKDVYNYTRKMSSTFTQQAQILAEAATGLNVAALAHEVQDYREKHLRETQKKALRMWWKVRGKPPAKRENPLRHEKCRKRRHARAMKGGNR
ncbi:hypothetical protein MMC34_002281 [Xylographa carneopallida]|nr:hypothetical protein [Xylographa carneopallida]